jgi:adenylosuccinate lyase
MIERYSTDRMRVIWSDAGTMSLWSTVERAMAEAQGAPEHVVKELWEKRLPMAEAGVVEWRCREATTRHDVVAFVELMRESVSLEAARWVHRGVTSSDLVDSAQAIRVKESLGMIAKAGQGLTNELGALAQRWSSQPWIGRTHGQWAQETTLGHLWSNRAMAVNKAVLKVRAAMGEQMVMMSGPVGDYKTLGGEKEGKAAEQAFGRLVKMPVAAKSTQVVDRGGLAEAMWACERLMAAIAQVATDVRLMGQSEVGEVAEAFAAKQRGSSIMAHKNNTVGAENLIGLERVVRANVMPVVEGVATWGMRDITHSAVERVCVPLVLGTTEYGALRCAKLMAGLVVRPERAMDNIDKTGGVLEAGGLVTWLTENGAGPKEAWEVVHEASKEVEVGDLWVGSSPMDLKQMTQRMVNKKVKNNEAGWSEFKGNWAEKQ